jgi:hypothetical protein
MSEKYLIWHIQGGLGKNVAATSLLKSIKENYSDRKLILVCSYPEIFLNNPYIDRVYGLGNLSHFYETYIYNKDVLIFKHEPYNQTGHILRNKHLIENWCDLLNIPYIGQTPELYPNYAQKVNAKKWFRSKPVIILQTGGGPITSNHYYCWTRDMPEEVASLIVDKYYQSYHIFHVTRPSGYKLSNVERVDWEMPAMELFGMLTVSSKRFLIDSSLQHAARAISLPSTVFWIGTPPAVFGYNFHTNITPISNPIKNNLLLSYTFNYQFDNNLHECPYNSIHEIYNVESIIERV